MGFVWQSCRKIIQEMELLNEKLSAVSQIAIYALYVDSRHIDQVEGRSHGWTCPRIYSQIARTYVRKS